MFDFQVVILLVTDYFRSKQYLHSKALEEYEISSITVTV